ncbi:hypothetical protein DENSPDRAFT_833570 [Dentipellis sp. KUC8613]|nr:hypothetical protein DENSPDRAFT_833570 [Dentipellis sp. KUC8613]
MVSQTRSLPAEVWMMIVDQVECHWDLRSLRSANRQLRALASRRLFKTLLVDDQVDQEDSICNALDTMQSPYLRPFITTLSYKNLWGALTLCLEFRQQLSSLCSQIHILPALSAIHCQFLGDDTWGPTPEAPQPDYMDPIYPEQLLILDTLFGEPLQPSVKSLTFGNLLPRMVEIYDRPTFVSAVQRLSHLDLSFVKDEQVGYWDTVVHKRFLGACGTALRSLHLARTGKLEQDPSITFDGLHFPSLHTLSLRWLFFDRTGSRESRCTLEQFIARHSDTLQHLELMSYYAVIKEGHVPGPGGPLTPVWDRLACAMDHLVRVTVFTYNQYRKVFERFPGKLLVMEYAVVGNDERQADIKALAKFHRAVHLLS